ncbi:hypothetical protein SCP_0411970 [Sparassis crispa]|uniref:DUF6699 domain-containing protein n=1 Tax=Sparassis crispa TaxID=139825 RepID=A0A401GKV6_9APHY|nr:hypothetical protein SCP_0411970 [Sparassis crispa]GBE82811.1 hypothetical protein SCP_0411970 [Sparassis crispa]
MIDSVGKWAPGPSYGPMLSQTDLYLLGDVELELNPILSATFEPFLLTFNITLGRPTGYNQEARDHDLPFTPKDEPATLPRVDQLIIITEVSPWCTIVRNPQGVTLGDICTALHKEYTENYVTDKELESLPPRQQDYMRRAAAAAANANTMSYPSYYSPQTQPSSRLRRGDWLQSKVWFDKLARKDHYVRGRLGYSAPNIFVLSLNNY